MRAEVTSKFNKDISKLHDRKLILSVKSALQHIESAKTLSEIPNLKKMTGSANYFRIRVGEYRMGIYFSNNTVFVVRFLHRREIYRYFP